MEIVLTNAKITVNAVNLSTRVKEIRLQLEASPVGPSAAMGVTWEEFLAGVKRWSGSIVFEQDYAAANVDVTIFSLVGAAAVAFTGKAIAEANSPTSPEFQGNILVTRYNPLDGRYGEQLMTTAEFQGTGTLTRAVA